MSVNPLKRTAESEIAHGEEYLLHLCDQNNRWAYKRGYPKFYYVEPAKPGGAPAQILTVSGIEAEEVWTVLEGKTLDYAGWSRERLEKIERRASWMIRRGIVETMRREAA